MSGFPQRFVLSSATCALVLALAIAAWVLVASSSEAQTGSMQNCPPVGMWSIAVWDGAGGTAAADALATCGAGAVDAAYSLDAQTGSWWRWFAANPGVSNLPSLADMQGVLALGSATGPVATPTLSPTATPTVSSTGTPTPSLDVELSQECFQAWTVAEAVETIIYAEEQVGISTAYMEVLLDEQDDFIQENCLVPSVAPVPDPASDTLCEDVTAMRLSIAGLISLAESEGVPHTYLSQHLAQLNTFSDSYCW